MVSSTSRSKSPMYTLPSGRLATCPDTNTKPPARVAEDSGTGGNGRPSGWKRSTMASWNHIPRRGVMRDLLLTGGLVVDGTGAAPRQADVLVRNGRVEAVGTGMNADADRRDVTGKVVCPGFVDIHTHS